MDWDRNNGILDNVLEAIGRTPLIRLNKVSAGVNADICVKLEYVNPSGSLKDRVVHTIVAMAEAKGELKPDMILLEGTDWQYRNCHGYGRCGQRLPCDYCHA